MPIRHFADCIAEPPLPGQPVTYHCARATLAELERAVRDSACTGIVTEVVGLGRMSLSKAEVRDRLQALRRRPDPPAFLYISIDPDGRILFDDLAPATYKVYDLETAMAQSLIGRDAQAANLRELAADMASQSMAPNGRDAAAQLATASRIVAAIAAAPAPAWTRWADRPPTAADGVIVAKDALGFIHLATHLVGTDEPGWAKAWLPVPVIAEVA